MASTNWLKYANQDAVRSHPLSDRLVKAMSFLPDMGVSMEVFSGGQPESGSNRVGSHRHDDGNAADVFFYKDGRRLDWANPQDRPVFEQIVERGKAAGLTGFGAGPGYMQEGSIHLGYGTPAVWGAGGRSANAPEWLRVAYGSEGPQPPVDIPPAASPAVAAIDAMSPQPGKPTFGLGYQAQPTGVGGLVPKPQSGPIMAGQRPTGIGGLLDLSRIRPMVQAATTYTPPQTMFSPTPQMGGTPVTAVSRSGNTRGFLATPGHSSSGPGGMNMDVYRANRAATGGPITQASIDKALASGRELYRL